MTAALPSAFWEKVDKSAGPDGCWPWIAARNPQGYGAFRRSRAHRVALEEAIGRSLTASEQACHHCDNKPCVNPAHLYVGDFFTNRRDRLLRGAPHPRKPFCVNGHAKTDDNVRLDRKGARVCLTCHRLRQRVKYWEARGLPIPETTSTGRPRIDGSMSTRSAQEPGTLPAVPTGPASSVGRPAHFPAHRS